MPGHSADSFERMVLQLFERQSRQHWAAIERINARYWVDKVSIATMHGQRGSAPRRIPFGRPSDLRPPDVDE